MTRSAYAAGTRSKMSMIVSPFQSTTTVPTPATIACSAVLAKSVDLPVRVGEVTATCWESCAIDKRDGPLISGECRVADDDAVGRQVRARRPVPTGSKAETRYDRIADRPGQQRRQLSGCQTKIARASRDLRLRNAVFDRRAADRHRSHIRRQAAYLTERSCDASQELSGPSRRPRGRREPQRADELRLLLLGKECLGIDRGAPPGQPRQMFIDQAGPRRFATADAAATYDPLQPQLLARLWAQRRQQRSTRRRGI